MPPLYRCWATTILVSVGVLIPVVPAGARPALIDVTENISDTCRLSTDLPEPSSGVPFDDPGVFFHAVPAGSNRAVVLFVQLRGVESLASTPTYNGTAFTYIGTSGTTATVSDVQIIAYGMVLGSSSTAITERDPRGFFSEVGVPTLPDPAIVKVDFNPGFCGGQGVNPSLVTVATFTGVDQAGPWPAFASDRCILGVCAGATTFSSSILAPADSIVWSTAGMLTLSTAVEFDLADNRGEAYQDLRGNLAFAGAMVLGDSPPNSTPVSWTLDVAGLGAMAAVAIQGDGLQVADTDGDSAPDTTDNCLLTTNQSQLDADLDLIGDSCQCGDSTDDGRVSIRDIAATTRALAGLPSGGAFAAPEKCNTIGDPDLADLNADGIPDDCEQADIDALRTSFATSTPIEQNCGPATLPFVSTEIISVNASNVNLFELLRFPEGPVEATLTIDTDTIVSSDSSNLAALGTGFGWAPGSSVTIVNNGRVQGRGGHGGRGGEGCCDFVGGTTGGGTLPLRAAGGGGGAGLVPGKGGRSGSGFGCLPSCLAARGNDGTDLAGGLGGASMSSPAVAEIIGLPGEHGGDALRLTLPTDLQNSGGIWGGGGGGPGHIQRVGPGGEGGGPGQDGLLLYSCGGLSGPGNPPLLEIPCPAPVGGNSGRSILGVSFLTAPATGDIRGPQE